MGGAAGPDFQPQTGEREMARKLEGKTAGGRPLERRDTASSGGGAGAEESMSVVSGAAPRGEASGATTTAADQPGMSPGAQAPRYGPVGVLVVDDSRVFRTGMVRAVQAFDGLELLGEADNGEEALEAIAELEPDVVILDLRMPRLDGFGVLERLHAAHDGPACRVLVISATLDDGVGDEVLAAGADACLSKAVSRAEICNAVLRLVAG
jgi:CheY-like chemotaxis protein